MTDLVERLRAASHDERLSTGMLYREAADEIERLRAACKFDPYGRPVHVCEKLFNVTAERDRLRAEVEQQRLELGITGDACGALDSEVKQLRAEVADLREECAGYRGLQADQANARCELLEMLKLERAKVAELEGQLERLEDRNEALRDRLAPRD